jgi:HTH-type transcriptional regulator/antitoxin HigA
MKAITTKVGRGRANGKNYLDLVRRFPLRPIRNRTDYDRAMEIVQELTARADRGVSADENDYADVLARLVRDYDQSHSTLLRERAVGRNPTAVEILKYLMDEHGMNTISLGKMVGGSGQASLILSGKRELSKANIRALAAHFHVSPAVFI